MECNGLSPSRCQFRVTPAINEDEFLLRWSVRRNLSSWSAISLDGAERFVKCVCIAYGTASAVVRVRVFGSFFSVECMWPLRPLSHQLPALMTPTINENGFLSSERNGRKFSYSSSRMRWLQSICSAADVSLPMRYVASTMPIALRTLTRTVTAALQSQQCPAAYFCARHSERNAEER